VVFVAQDSVQHLCKESVSSQDLRISCADFSRKIILSHEGMDYLTIAKLMHRALAVRDKQTAQANATVFRRNTDCLDDDSVHRLAALRLGQIGQSENKTYRFAGMFGQEH
jgi:hypothetical protein